MKPTIERKSFGVPSIASSSMSKQQTNNRLIDVLLDKNNQGDLIDGDSISSQEITTPMKSQSPMANLSKLAAGQF